MENTNEQIETLLSALQSTQKELEESKAEIRLLYKRLDAKEKELEDLRESKDKMRDHLMEGNIRIYDRESENLYTIDEQEKELHGLRDETLYYKKEIAKLQEQIADLEKQLEEKNNELKWERIGKMENK